LLIGIYTSITATPADSQQQHSNNNVILGLFIQQKQKQQEEQIEGEAEQDQQQQQGNISAIEDRQLTVNLSSLLGDEKAEHCCYTNALFSIQTRGGNGGNGGNGGLGGE